MPMTGRISQSFSFFAFMARIRSFRLKISMVMPSTKWIRFSNMTGFTSTQMPAARNARFGSERTTRETFLSSRAMICCTRPTVPMTIRAMPTRRTMAATDDAGQTMSTRPSAASSTEVQILRLTP